MATHCVVLIRGTVMRITKLDSCGVPVAGPKSVVVSEGFVSVEARMNLEDPQEYKLKGANDKFIVNTRGKSQIKWVDLTVNFGNVDPDVYNLTTGAPLEMNDATIPEAVGFRIREGMDANFGLEVWTDLAGQACVGGTPAWGYSLWPFVKDAVPGDQTWQNDVISFPIQSARTEAGSGWGVGPYNILNKLSAPTGPSPLLVPIAAKDHQVFQKVTVAPPTPTCGAQALSI